MLKKVMKSIGDDFFTKPENLELLALIQSVEKSSHEDIGHIEQMLFSIVRLIESRDPNVGAHCQRLFKLGKSFGSYLHLTSNQIRDLTWGAYLHDIGKLAIPDAVLMKTGKLTTEDWNLMKQHVVIGEKICQPLSSMQSVLKIVRHHHERWDGLGYPDGLRGDEIPYVVQVFQIIDIYDALTSDRPYKKALSPEESLSLMWVETNAGWRNPQLMQQFTEYFASELTK